MGRRAILVASSSPSSSVCGKMSPPGESLGTEVDTGGLTGSGLVVANTPVRVACQIVTFFKMNW